MYNGCLIPIRHTWVHGLSACLYITLIYHYLISTSPSQGPNAAAVETIFENLKLGGVQAPDFPTQTPDSKWETTPLPSLPSSHSLII